MDNCAVEGFGVLVCFARLRVLMSLDKARLGRDLSVECVLILGFNQGITVGRLEDDGCYFNW